MKGNKTKGEKGGSLITFKDVAVFTGVCTAIYFLFLRGNKAFSQTVNDFTGMVVDGKEGDDRVFDDGRKKYYDKEDQSDFIRGYPLPESIEGINFIPKRTFIIVKPNETGLFGGVAPKAMLNVFRVGNKIAYKGSVQGYSGTYLENYEDLKGKVVVANDFNLKTNENE